MDAFATLYVLYFAKLGIQFAIFILSFDHPHSSVIKYLAAVTALLAVSPVFHTIIHLRGRPMPLTPLIGYCSLRYDPEAALYSNHTQST